MLVTYSRDASIFDAVSKTFDGEHPCKLCKEIQKGRGEEKKQDNETVKPGYKLELGVLWNPLSIAFDHYPKQVTTFQIVVESKSEEPPTPPPKLLSSDYLV
jgi:hypothetical protein